ncbi:MAG TPA: hypothetical protein DCL44_04010 [Elusimicrobia bacterium]|nr:hypothetical protein [Elusimicrobiota bacterium]
MIKVFCSFVWVGLLMLSCETVLVAKGFPLHASAITLVAAGDDTAVETGGAADNTLGTKVRAGKTRMNTVIEVI